MMFPHERQLFSFGMKWSTREAVTLAVAKRILFDDAVIL
jgi:hypothetical protein